VCVLTTPDHLAEVPVVAGWFGDVPILLDHVGGIGAGTGQPAEVLDTLLGLAAYNVYLKVSTVNLAPLEAAGETALALWRPIVARYGARRLLWGSNYPVSQEGSYADMVALGRRALPFLDDAERGAFLGGAAVHLWPQLAGIGS
jgi:predicted TIM-barrel fold metal-dependent hydrolase